MTYEDALITAYETGSILMRAKPSDKCKCGHAAECHVECFEMTDTGKVTGEISRCWGVPWRPKGGSSKDCRCKSYKPTTKKR